MLGLAGQIIGAGIDTAVAIGNYNKQKEQTAYLKEMQQKTWEREDSAIQRRVADLQAAGLSPTLAAGSAAQTSNPIQVGAPEYKGPSAQDKALQMQQLALNLEAQKANIAQTNAQTMATISQAKYTDQKTKYETETYGDRTAYVKLQNEIASGNITRQTLDNVMSQKTMDDRIQLIKNDVDKYGLYKVTNEIENQAKREGISLTKLNIVAKEIENSYADSLKRFEVSQEQTRAFSMAIAEQILGIQKQMQTMDYNEQIDRHEFWNNEGFGLYKAGKWLAPIKESLDMGTTIGTMMQKGGK